MKRFGLSLAFVAALALAAPAYANDTPLLAAVTTNVASAAVPVGAATRVVVQVYSASTSVASVIIKQRLSTSANWYTVATITNPSSSGEIYAGPGGGFVSVEVTGYGSGTITAYAEAWVGVTKLY